MIRTAIITLIFLFSWQLLSAQSAGDFRSLGPTGNWNTNISWETYNGSAWVTPLNPPNELDGVITIRAGHTITCTTSEIMDQVTVLGTLKVNLSATISFPAVVTGDAILVTGTFDVTGTVAMAANSIIRVNGTMISRQGSVISGASASNLLLQANSFYQYTYTSATVAGAIPTASWNISSTLLINGTSSLPPANLAQGFGNVTFDIAAVGAAMNLAGALTTVHGNLSTGLLNTKSINLATGGAYTLTVDGDFILNGNSILTVNTATTGNNIVNVLGSWTQNKGTFILVAGGANGTMNVKKDFIWTGGSYSKAGAGTATLVFNGTTTQNYNNAGNFTFGGVFNAVISSGSTVDMGTTPLIMTGVSTFTVNSGGNLIVGSTNSSGAIVSGTTVGNIRVAGTRSFLAGSTITYHNASGTQLFLGSGHPSDPGVVTVVDNSGGVKVAGSTSINGSIILTNGDLDISGVIVSLGGTFTPNANSLVANFSTDLTITDVGSTADFILKPAGSSVMGDLTINGARAVKLGADLAVLDQVDLLAGDLQLNGFTLNIQGTITQSGGALTSNAASGLVISDEGGGILPADLVIGGGSINTITMNRLGFNFTTTSTIIVTNLNLVAGDVTPTTNFKMASGGLIKVTSGTLTNPVGAVTNYNVEYDGVDDIETGAELPVTSTILNNLTNSSGAGVTLSAPATVNGSIILNSGTFYTNSNQVTLNGNLLSNAASHFLDTLGVGQIIFNGTTIISGDSIPDFGNILVNAGKALTIDQDLQINVAGNFTVDGSFDPGQGKVYLNGTQDQNIDSPTGPGPIPFYQLEINKPLSDVNVLDTTHVRDILKISSATVLNAGNEFLRLTSTAARTARVNPLPVGASINGNVIAERYLPNNNNLRAYRYLASPVTNAYVSDWMAELPVTGPFDDPSTGPGIVSTSPSLFYYDETYVAGGPNLEDRYRSYPVGLSTGAPLINGLGYAMFIRRNGPAKLDTRGTLAQQQQILNVTAQSGGGNDGWNLIGNPYASPVAWDKVTKGAGVDNAIWLRDNTNISPINGVITYADGVVVPAVANLDGSLASGQGFWIHTTANSSVTFDESDKVVSSDSLGTFYRTAAPKNILRITVAGGGLTDEAVIRIADKATDSFDNQIDALKYPTTELSLVTKSQEGRDLTINAIGFKTCYQSLQLVVKNVTPGSYTFSTAQIETFSSDMNVVIVDSETGSAIDLRKGDYPFTVTTANVGSIGSRFTLQINQDRILTDLLVNTQPACSNEAVTNLVIHNSQPEVEYKSVLKGSTVNDWTFGNGGDLIMVVDTRKLALGNNVFDVILRNKCNSDTLMLRPSINKFVQPVVTKVDDGLACQSGITAVQAYGATDGEFYNWYKSASAPAPFETETTGKLSLTGLKGNSTLYVSISNPNGCESERSIVNIKAVEYKDILLTQLGDSLISNYETGNKWFYNGAPIDTANSNVLEVDKTGTYSVRIEMDGCIASDSVIAKVKPRLKDFSIYPNPAPDNVTLYLKNFGEGSVCIDIVSLAGTDVVYKKCFEVDGLTRIAMPSLNLAPGIYIVRVSSSTGTISKRLVKI